MQALLVGLVAQVPAIVARKYLGWFSTGRLLTKRNRGFFSNFGSFWARCRATPRSLTFFSQETALSRLWHPPKNQKNPLPYRLVSLWPRAWPTDLRVSRFWGYQPSFL